MRAPALYTYFPSLGDLFTELIVQSYKSLEGKVTHACADAKESDLEQRLAAGPVAYRA